MNNTITNIQQRIQKGNTIQKGRYRMRFFTKSKASFALIGIVCIGLVHTSLMKAGDSQTVLYVKADTAGAGNGMTWLDAYNTLQDALAVAMAGDQIWVTSGTYTPGGPGERTASFELKSGVEIYGGFVGTEVTRDERNPAINLTVLSGDLNGDDVEVLEPPALANEPTRSDNSYHVVIGSGTDETAVLDGFVITGGNANGSGRNIDGGGMINIGSTNGLVLAKPTLVNCIFYGNSADRKGGGIYNEVGTPTLINCVFSENHSNASSGPPTTLILLGGGVCIMKEVT